MRRESGTAPILEDAVAAVLEDQGAAGSGVRSTNPSSEERVVDQALEGHSPSARALANAGDAFVDLASSAVTTTPAASVMASLEDRILKDVGAEPKLVRSTASTMKSPKALPVTAAFANAPNEVIGRMHAKLETEVRRAEVIERLGAMGAFGAPGGASGHEETDRALRLLVDQYAPFLGFQVVFVSTVVRGLTIHRVHRGFPPELGNLDVIPRELSFCTHTVSAGEPFVVEDASKEAFFRGSDLVQKFGCRAYLGVPLVADGVIVGALCGISGSAQVIFPEDVELAQRFAHIAQALVAHDHAAIAQLVAEPKDYPGETRPVVLSSDAFSAIVEAQRQRIGAAASTWLIPLDKDTWQSVAPDLPQSVLVGLPEPGSADERRLLVPEDHEEFEKLTSLRDKGERLV